ncbi:37s ribosomal protein s18 [Diaporthe amygdali]|uniref:37s ribosomal protein s18 n=1 Tax=Phomopsis amygdali TaxID=1214568 RepID=UPI0022FDCB0A|nr:37s ribosomal protein s18 [Diaporthe amygdali]KAJ0120353.1 37s ribosomal protein s18 [Diaporthe amygdali]
MPPRLSLQPLSRHLKPLGLQTNAAFSSTARNGVLKLTEADASRKLLHFDENQEPNSPSGPRGRNAFNRSSPDQPNSATPHDALSSLMSSTRAYDRLTIRSDNTAQRAKDNTYRESLARQATRNWKPGDIYAPHDLSPQEMVKWKQPKQPSKDIIDMLGLNPLDHYRNFSIMAEFMTTMGRIKHSRETGLRPVNQRKMAKAIRRSIGMGLHPSTHHHPMILFHQKTNAPRYQNTKIPDPDRQKFKPK